MKSRSFFLMSLACIFIIISCSDKYFDEYPSDAPTENTFFHGPENIKMMLNDAYFTMRSVYQFYYYVADLTSDDSYNSKFNNSSDHITINESNVTSSNGAIGNLWTNSYNVIARCNMVLEQSEKISMDATVKQNYQNEAKFIRALIYFNLVRIFGDVPLVLKDIKTSEEAFSYGRESLENVYAQIQEDLTAAKSLPSFYVKNEDKGRATSWAAKSLLAKIYLTQKNYTAANAELEDIINNSPHILLDSYADIFAADNPNNDEIIFAIQYARGFDPSMGNPLVTGCFPNETIGQNFGSGILATGTGTFLMTEELDALYTATDTRRSMIYRMEGNRRSYIFTMKYYDTGMITKVDSGCDWIVLRFADVLLMYAEVQNELNNVSIASTYVNAVRIRAGLDISIPVATDQAGMRLAIELERRLELFCEGHRWFDLVRTGRAITVMNAHFNSDASNEEIGENCSVEEYELIFPVPNNQVLLNPDKIKQNPGY
jgi:hypothetical protein